MARGLASLMAAMSRPSWKPGRRHGTHTTLSPNASLVSCSPSAAVAIAMPESGCRWSTCAGVDEPVHRGVDRGCGAALAVQAVVEGGDHLVLAVHTGVDVDERAHPVQPQHREAARGQGAEVAAGALHPQQLDVLTRDGVGLGALGGGVAAGVVGVLRVGAQPVRALDELGNGGVQVTHGAVPCHRRSRRSLCDRHETWWGVEVSSSRPASRRRGPPRSAAGSRSRGRRASGRPAGRAPRATPPGHGVRRCRRRP